VWSRTISSPIEPETEGADNESFGWQTGEFKGIFAVSPRKSGNTVKFSLNLNTKE
jgi:hypothetical protein